MVFYRCLARSSSFLILQVFILCHCPLTHHFPEYFSFTALNKSREKGPLPKQYCQAGEIRANPYLSSSKNADLGHNQVYMQGRCLSHHNSVQKRHISKSEKCTSPFPHFSQRRVFIDWAFWCLSGSWPLNTNFSDWCMAVAKPNLVSALFDSNLQR